jgi:hypothetical protein
MRIARGLFRLWLVFAALWIAGVAIVTWWTFPVDDWFVPALGKRMSDKEFKELPDAPWITKESSSATTTEPPRFDPTKPYQVALDSERRAALQSAALLALVPPVFVLALGAALGWAFEGFRSKE